MAEFDRQNPLFERNEGPVEVISTENNKSNDHFTVRILSGHRPLRNGSGRERVFRFEMSDECNMVKTVPSFEPTSHGCKTPINNRQTSGLNFHRTPHAPVIQAPFMTADRGGREQIPNNSGHFRERGVDVALSQMQLSQKANAITTNRPIELYELEVGESDFEELRRRDYLFWDQALLVDFEDFANSLISLMHLCWSVDEDHGGDIPHQYSSGNVWDTTNRAEVQWGNAAWDGHQQQHNQQRVLGNASPYSQHYTMRNSSSYSRPPVSTYTCRLETSTQASNTTNNTQCRKGNIHFTTGHARFTIVESNQFRELTHLALTLNIGTDKSVRQYLSSRLSQAMVQIADVQNHLEIQRQRCEVAERNAINANKRLGDTTQACEAEKYRLQCQAEERFQTESSCRLAEFDSIKAAKDTEIQALKDELQRCKLTFDDKVRLLEESNRKINEEKSSCQSEKDRLSSQLGQQETANRLLANEVSSLRARLERITEEKSATEKNLSELQLLLASVETTTNAHQNTINQSEAHIASTERVYADAKLTISRQHSQINELQRRLAESESEATRYKELAGRYQSNRAEMKKQIKEKAETIRQQEDTIRDGEKEMIETKHRVESLSGNLKRTQAEKEAAMNELTASKKMLDEATKKLDNNQQVIAWLNKQLQSGRNPSSGVVWQGSTPKPPPPRHESTPAVPAAVPNINQSSLPARSNPVMSSSLSRYLPSATLSTNHRGVTPEIKAASVSQGLHPSPHPL